MSDQDSADESDVQNRKNSDDRGLSPELGGAAVDVENALQTTETVQSLCTKFSHMSVSNTMNPYDLGNNCVYITIAHLLGQNLHDYLTTTEQMLPPSSVKGISLDDVDAMLKQSGKQLFGYQVENTQTFRFDEYAQSSGQDAWGVLYITKKGDGHCIVYEDNGFRDYQLQNPALTEPEAWILDKIQFFFSVSSHDAPQAPAANTASASGTGSGAADGADDDSGKAAMEVDDNAEDGSGKADMEVDDDNDKAAEPAAAAAPGDYADEPDENQGDGEDAEMADGTTLDKDDLNSVQNSINSINSSIATIDNSS